MKNKLTHKFIIGLLLLPFAFILYFCDRLILTFLPHLDGLNMKKWFNDTQSMINSVIRTSIVALIYILYKIIQFRING